jgi:hypothetical protein
MPGIDFYYGSRDMPEMEIGESRGEP